MLAYISGQFGMSILNSGTQHIIAYVGIFGSVLPAVFIYAAAPASGGHINPLVTWSTFWCGLCPAARGELSSWLTHACPVLTHLPQLSRTLSSRP